MARSTSRTALQPAHKMTQLAACVALALASANVLAQAPATVTATASTTAADANKVETVIVTGSRIKAAALTATSPVSQFSAEDIALVRAVTVEDFSVKLPQLAGGVNSTSAGSDAFGAQTLDLRNLGQSRTLVLINGTRAVPFSFRNAVDVNFIPAPLLKRVDVLTAVPQRCMVLMQFLVWLILLSATILEAFKLRAIIAVHPVAAGNTV